MNNDRNTFVLFNERKNQIAKPMLNILIVEQKNPYFNLALEEYLFKNKDEDYFILYQCNPSVIIGKHQNIFEEINYDFVKTNNISIARRLSGGGTVFHDEGNLNFSWIAQIQDENKINFARFINPIVTLLKKLGLSAEIGGKNDILVDGYKISGNAEHIYKNKVLHHGTLLFDADLRALSNAIKKESPEYQSHSIKSIRSKVANIKTLGSLNMSLTEFMEYLIKGIVGLHPDSQLTTLNSIEIEKIQQLVTKKYNSQSWIWGYNPPYTMKKTLIKEGNTLQIDLSVKHNIIHQCLIYYNLHEWQELSEILLGTHHIPEELEKNIHNLFLKKGTFFNIRDIALLIQSFY